MNKKIQNMIEELAVECQKEDVTLSLSTLDETGICSLAQVGKNQQIELVIANQIEQWEKFVKACNCPKCKLRASELEPEPESEDLHDQLDDFTEKLAAFFRGDLT